LNIKGDLMRSTQQFSITLPNEMANMVRAKVEAGAYASESEVIRDGLRALAARDHAVESWLRATVVPAAQALQNNPDSALSADQVREHLAKRRKVVRKAQA
jgi:putative addiction module CopG family antidote